MKKMFFALVALFTIQIGFAQGSAEAKNYIQNMGIEQQLNATKTQLLPAILEENKTDFNKEFDQAVQTYLNDLETLVAENFDDNDLKKFNDDLSAGTTPQTLVPANAQSFQERAEAVQMNFGQTLNTIVQKHADPAILQEM